MAGTEGGMLHSWTRVSGPAREADRTARVPCLDMSDPRSSRVTLDDIPDAARRAWSRLRDELRAILGEDLVAVWAHGGTIAAGRQPRAADLDTYVIVNRRPDEATAQRIEAAHDAIAQEQGVDWDVWYVLADDARRPDAPHHAYREGRRDTSWAINRAHWLAGRYVHLFGREPAGKCLWTLRANAGYERRTGAGCRA